MTPRRLAWVAMMMCAGCAAMFQGPALEPGDDEASEGNEKGIVCRLEARTGSNRRERVCYSTEPSTFEERDQIDSVMGSRATPTPPKTSNGR